MKHLLSSAVALLLLGSACQTHQENSTTSTLAEGEVLFGKVKKFVAFGEHRTGTRPDSLTAEWLKAELDTLGAKTEFVDFPLQQFFYESGKLTSGGQSAEIFPLWPVKKTSALTQKAAIADGDKVNKGTSLKGKLVFTRFRHTHGGASPETVAQLQPFLEAGAVGVVAVTENNTGEIVALNTFEGQQPWSVPVYLIAPKDTSLILSATEKKSIVEIEVKGELKEAKGRDVVAKIGTGKQYVVVSTPTSGWFTTGGERGPGIAIWLGLAKWAAAHQKEFSDYTFVFTGNAGHELNILGALVFVEKVAPKPEQTALWIHLGAGVAVKEWKEVEGKWELSDSVDGKRGIYYAASLAPAFEKTFASIKAKKTKGTKENEGSVKPGGEGALFKEKGYHHLLSLAYGHRYHHVKTDDETATSPALLLELKQALEAFITEQLRTK